MQIEIKAATNIGKVREANEDSFCILKAPDAAYICDGMGGHAAGATASQLAIDTIARIHRATNPDAYASLNDEKAERLAIYFYQLNNQLEPTLPDAAAKMLNGVQLANARIHQTAYENPHLLGMGTTVVGFSFVDNLSLIVHVGDSRAYRIRNKKIEQLTLDHSWVNELVQTGKIDPGEAKKFPHRNVITRALGVNPSVRADLRLDPVQAGDYFLISSDGLHDLVSEEDILAQIIRHPDDLTQTLAALIELANAQGGRDNISAAIAKILDADSFPNEYYYKDSIPEESPIQTELELKILGLLLNSKNE
jgi:protein phosphatase